jgi:polyphenol oxidase
MRVKGAVSSPGYFPAPGRPPPFPCFAPPISGIPHAMKHVFCTKEVTEGIDGSARSVLSRLEGMLGGSPVFCMDQIHSDIIVFAEDLARSEIPRADAIISRDMSHALCVRTADCVPVLAWAEDMPVIAAIHAGWRGLALGIVEKTILAMQSLGARDLRAAIGPAIGPCCYEVKSDVVEALGVEPVRSGRGNLAVNLWDAARSQLEKAGVGAGGVETHALCTSCDPVRFNSFRRQGEHAGRNISVIGGKAWSLPGLQAG